MSFSRFWSLLKPRRRLPDGFSRSPDVSTAREILADEQRRLSDELERTLVAYRDRLDRFTRNVSLMNDADVEREADALHQTQSQLRQAIKRVGLVERETAELSREWEDWEHARSAGAPMDALARERREMIRSELAVRGNDVGDVPSDEEGEVEEEEVPVEEPAMFFDHTAREEADELEEWDELLRGILEKTSADEDASPLPHIEAVHSRRLLEAERKRLQHLL